MDRPSERTLKIHVSEKLCPCVQVPLRLVEHIDQGKSTDSFVKELIVEAQARNQEARGRTAALEELQVCLAAPRDNSTPDPNAEHISHHRDAPICCLLAGSFAEARRGPRPCCAAGLHGH